MAGVHPGAVHGLVVAAATLRVARWSGLRARSIGLNPRRLRAPVVFGLVRLGAIALVFGIAAAVPGLRGLFGDARLDTLGVGTLAWVTLVRIPLGTVLLEEIAFRGVLPALLGAGDRWRWRPGLVAAALFGLWHAFPSLAMTQNAVIGTAFGGVPVLVVSVLTMLAAAVAGWSCTGGATPARVSSHRWWCIWPPTQAACSWRGGCSHTPESSGLVVVIRGTGLVSRSSRTGLPGARSRGSTTTTVNAA